MSHAAPQTASPITASRTAVRTMLPVMLTLFELCVCPSSLGAQQAIQDQGGPIMQSPTTVYLIFWLPTGSVYDTNSNLNPAGVGNYETLMQRFFTDVSQSNYFKILTQYPGTCGSNTPTQQSCFGGITVGGTFVDTRAYPHAGTQQDPLNDSPDIRGEVQRIITNNNLTAGLNAEFFVFTAANIQECGFGSCTFAGKGLGQPFCAYHSEFNDANNEQTVYAFIADVNYLSGCEQNVSQSPNGQISSDRAVVAVTHEFFESYSDPLLNNWVIPASVTEIGDNCNQAVGINLMSDGSNVSLNGNPYIVQEIWSNNDDGCVLSASTIISGPSVENNFLGGPVRGDTSTSNSLQSGINNFQNLPVHMQGGVPWRSGTIHIRVLPFTVTPIPGLLPQGTPLQDESLSLTSHPTGSQDNDQWVVQSIDAKIRNPNGTLVCEQISNIDIGHPPVITDGKPYVFQTPNCQFNLFIMGPTTETVGDSQSYGAFFWSEGIDPSIGLIQWTVSGPASWSPSSTASQNITYTGTGLVTVKADVDVGGSHLSAVATTSVVEPKEFSPQAAAFAQLVKNILSSAAVNQIINPLGPDVALSAERRMAIEVLTSVQSFVNVTGQVVDPRTIGAGPRPISFNGSGEALVSWKAGSADFATRRPSVTSWPLNLKMAGSRNPPPSNPPSSPVTFYYDEMGNLASIVGAGQVPPPQFLPGEGTYTCPQNVRISDPDSAAAILYTTGSGVPMTTYASPIAVNNTQTIRAIAVDNNLNPSQSAVVSATYSCSTTHPPLPPTNLNVVVP